MTFCFSFKISSHLVLLVFYFFLPAYTCVSLLTWSIGYGVLYNVQHTNILTSYFTFEMEFWQFLDLGF